MVKKRLLKIHLGNSLDFSRFLPKRSKKTGKPPGTILYLGKKRIEDVTIDIVEYDKISFNEKTTLNDSDLYHIDKNTRKNLWINVNGVHKTEIIKKIGEIFNLHSLIIEDIVNLNQRPKIEYYDDVIFVVLKMITIDQDNKNLNSEQISLILGKNFVLSFQEDDTNDFNLIKERIKAGKNKISKLGCDYLMYSLIDSIIDNYFIVLEKIGEYIEYIEQETLIEPKIETQTEIYRLKRELILLRKSVWPLREVLSSMQREYSKLINKNILVYLRDTYDHTIQIIDTVETFRDMFSSILDLYLSSVSNKMNEIMKVLTVISTVFIPLTFIVGVYGMNFDYMPELRIWWFYPLIMGIMIAVGLAMFIFFKKKKWI